MQSIISLERRLNLYQLLSQESPDLVCLVETWIDDSIPDSVVFCGMPYTVIARSDRNQGKHGGILIAAHDSFLELFRVTSLKIGDFFVSGVFSNCFLQLGLVLVYLPPRGSKCFTSASFAENCILDLYSNFKQTDASSQETKFVVMGDFNLPNVNWESTTTAISVDQSLLDSMTQELLLEQIIRSPTHKRGNILDLVFVSQPDAFDYEVLPASFLDHYPLIISYDYLPCYVAPFSSEFSANGFNQNVLESKIDLIDFEAAPSLLSTSEFLLKTFVDVISSCLVRKRKKRKLFPFYNTSLTMHSINKLETAKRQLSSKHKLDKLKKELMDVVELDKVSFPLKC